MPFGHICSFLTFFYSLFLSLGTKLEIIILNLFTLSRVVSKSINSYPRASKCLARDSVTRQRAANQASWISHSTSFPQTELFWLLLLPTTPLPRDWTITLNYFLKVVCAICHITGLGFCFLLSSGDARDAGRQTLRSLETLQRGSLFSFLLLWTRSLVKNANIMKRILRSFWSRFRCVEVKDIQLYKSSIQKQILWLWIWVSWSLKGQCEVGTPQFNLS